MSSKQTKTLYYNTYITFPHNCWAIKARIPRKKAVILCKELHAIIGEKEGASFYYPDLSENMVTCRYEWLRKWRGHKIGLHLGIFCNISRKGLKEVLIYVTTNEAVEDNTKKLPNFSSAFLSRLQKECIQTLKEAEKRLNKKTQRKRYVVFHVKLHPEMAFQKAIKTKDNRIKIFPSVLTDEGKIVSAVCISEDASSNESAKPKAIKNISLLCALLTLANDSLFEITYLKWSQKKPQIQFLNSLNKYDIKCLYPTQKKPPVRFNKQLPKMVKFIWEAYNQLSEKNKKIFMQSLFAYYSGKYVDSKKHPTLAVVAYVAALSSLSETKRKQCKGQIRCSNCGSISFKHNITGDKAAIILLINSLIGMTPQQKSELKKLIDRVYYKQRSSFVHGAELRHEEFYKNYQLPTCFPDINGNIGDKFIYTKDLRAIQLITRRTLIEWLFKKSKITLDKKLLDIDELRINVEIPLESSISLPAKTVVVPFHNGVKH